MTEFAKGLLASSLVGMGVGSMILLANKDSPPAKSASVGLVGAYPLFLFPGGLLSESLVRRLALHYTPYDFQKNVKDKPHRLYNYMFNKRFMMVDLPLGQVILPFVMVTGCFYLLPILDDFFAPKFDDNKGRHFKRKLKEEDAKFLVKSRWMLIMARIVNEIVAGYRELRGIRSSFRVQGGIGAALNGLWHFMIFQTLLEDNRTNSALSKP